MPWTRYGVARKVTADESLPYLRNAPLCAQCNVRLIRIAEREVFPPYNWIPAGWECGTCNYIDLEVY